MQRFFQYSNFVLLLTITCVLLFSCANGDTKDVSASLLERPAESSSQKAQSPEAVGSSLIQSPGSSAAESVVNETDTVSSQASSADSSSSSSQAVSSKQSSSQATSKAASKNAEKSVISSSSGSIASSSKASGKAQDYGARLSDDPNVVVQASFYHTVEDEILLQLNDLRVSLGLNPLSASTSLAKGAGIRAKEMFDYEYFAHTRPDGSSWETVFHVDVPLSNCLYIGENLERYENLDPDATTIMNLWIQSPAHYENMVKADYTHVGIRVFYGEMVDGSKLLYAVQEFGTFT